ncbi:pre-B-cell leukemia homeobox interacting protein 1b isoform X3 [Puntigrus tetrazona]|uniref:pre-B-cell leukemia homeobox interacting protein 1b isoform X3 n=1 Tax=Puntigrus tetrazona TaxID=1606681 RepID=UPI001C899089|nr:pre-B-cell leukemia homeobox interacting protein 1b isoform X3 [Puntigrus tetrazona]
MSENSNSWTLLAPEVKESGAENEGPVAEGLKIEGQISKAPEPSPEAHSDLEKHSSAHQPDTDTDTDSALTQGSEPLEPSQQVTSPETSEGRAQLNAAHVSEEPSSISGTVEDISSWTADHEKQGHSENPVIPSPDVDSFSDTYTHISSTSGSSPLPASVCQERDLFKSDEDSMRKTTNEDSKEALETNGKEGDGLRKRKISHLGSLDKTEAEDDEEGEEEDFQPPQREEETVFSLNKCILAAVILLGLGTIFFSGMLMDLDGADMDVRELKDPTNQEWLNPEISKDTPVGLQPPDILSKQVKEDQQILVLQEQLQQHQGELKAAQLRAEEGEKERVRREELEKEYERIKGELDRVPTLQKELAQENERMKEESVRAKKELEALPSLQRELEHLRAKVSQLTRSTGRAESVGASRMPSTGDKSDDMKPRKTWDKKSEEKEQSKGDKEWKRKKSGKKEDDKESRERVTEGKHTKEQKDWKKDKSHQEAGKGKQKEERKEWKKDKKQDYDKMGKASEEKKDFKWEEKKEWKEDKKPKKDKNVGQDEKRGDKKDAGNKKVREEKEWKQRGERKEDKDWKSDKRNSGNDHKEGKEKRKGEKEWRKEKSEGKHNDKTDKKWKGDKEFPKEYDEKEEKQWREKQRESKDKEWSRDGGQEEKKKKAPYHKNHSPNEKEKQHKKKHGHEEAAETSSHHHYDHENYWSKQRQRIQHYDGPRDTCSGVADCARVEGLSPVSLQDFQSLLQSYLKKLQDQDQTSRKEELSKLVKEFFTDGVFAHDQMPFREFVEDVGDILEDMAEGEESDSEGEESEEDDDDDEMEEFEREAMEKFALPEEVRKVEQKKESRRVKG